MAVHTDCVFIDGRIAAGSRPVDIKKIVRDVYRAAGYGGSWNPEPGKIRVTTELCEEVLPARNQTSDPSPMTRTSSSATPAATSGPITCRWLTGSPANSAVASSRGCERRGSLHDLRTGFQDPGLVEVAGRNTGRMASHGPERPARPKIGLRTAHRIVLRLLEQVLRDLEAGGLEGVASTFAAEKLLLNGAGEFAVGGPEGDNGLSGKKLVIDHYGPSVPIGGGALCGQGSAQGG